MPKTKVLPEAQDKPQPGLVVQTKPETPEKAGGPSSAGRLPGAVLPTATGMPPAVRAADAMAAPERSDGAADRARMMTAMQRTVGNTRVGQLVGWAPQPFEGTRSRAQTAQPGQTEAERVVPQALAPRPTPGLAGEMASEATP